MQGNLALLAVWVQMLKSCAQADLGDAARINAAAAGWAAAVSLSCLDVRRMLGAWAH